MKPDIRIELEPDLIGHHFEKHYYCPSCGKRLELGSSCPCGVRLEWDGVKDYEARKKRKK